MKIGIVDVDTSHPAAWIPIERELGHEVVGVWDGGTVHPPEYVRAFAIEHKIGRVFDSLDAMAREVDAAIIHGCDWDTHLAKAEPFVKAGKAVLIDKPIAGNAPDLRKLEAWVREGARITGGSSLRFAFEVRDFLAKPEAERGRPHTVLTGCAVDDFNYGIHAYAMLSAIIGTGVTSVRHVRADPQRRVQVNYADGRVGFVVIGAAAAWQPSYASIVTERGCHQFIVDTTRVYRALLERVLPYLAGETSQPPISFHELVEPERVAIAARRSWLEGDREVRLADLDNSSQGYDGAAFGVEYRRMKYPDAVPTATNR